MLLAVSESDAETLARAPVKKPFTQLTTYKAAYTKKEMKERVENSRQAISNPFLGALESLVVYFQALIEYCDTEMSDARHLDAMVDFLPDLVIGDVISPCGCGLAFKLPMMVAERNITPPASWLRVAAARDLRKSAAALAREQEEQGGKEKKPAAAELISIPRVAVAVLPMLDPLLPNIQENLPNHLGTVPQVGTGFPAARADAADLDPADGSLGNRAARLLGLLGATNRGLMPLWQRCVNVAFYLGAHAIHELRVRPLYMALGARHGVEVDKAFLHSATLILFNSDFAVEAPRPLPPNALFVGSIMSRPARPLPGEPWDELLGKRKGQVRVFFFFFFSGRGQREREDEREKREKKLTSCQKIKIKIKIIPERAQRRHLRLPGHPRHHLRGRVQGLCAGPGPPGPDARPLEALRRRPAREHDRRRPRPRRERQGSGLGPAERPPRRRQARGLRDARRHQLDLRGRVPRRARGRDPDLWGPAGQRGQGGE